MTAEFHNHPLVDLEKLFLDDRVEILRLQQELEAHGWCFLRLSQNARLFATQLNHIREPLATFFSGNLAKKSPYLSSDAFGYTRVNHKEGIKLLTDQQGNITSRNALPTNLNATLQHLSQLISDLTSRLKPIIFNLTGSNHRRSEQVEISELSMLDIAHYFNQNRGPSLAPEVGFDTNEVNCVPHYDPGLFSLSILSTLDGLQLKDQRTNTWIDGPDNSQTDQSNIGAIWLGQAASTLTGNRLKAGIHRVIYPRMAHHARLTIWQEVCTNSQLQQLSQHAAQTLLLQPGVQVTLANQPGSKPIAVLPGGENQHDFMRRMEGERGISLSKLAPSDLRIYPQRPFYANNQPSPLPIQQQNYVPNVQQRHFSPSTGQNSSQRSMNSNNYH